MLKSLRRHIMMHKGETQDIYVFIKGHTLADKTPLQNLNTNRACYVVKVNDAIYLPIDSGYFITIGGVQYVLPPVPNNANYIKVSCGAGYRFAIGIWTGRSIHSNVDRIFASPWYTNEMIFDLSQYHGNFMTIVFSRLDNGNLMNDDVDTQIKPFIEFS